MLPSDRQKKIDRYNLYDPNAVHKGRQYYDSLAVAGSGSEYRESEVIQKIKDYIEKLWKDFTSSEEQMAQRLIYQKGIYRKP